MNKKPKHFELPLREPGDDQPMQTRDIFGILAFLLAMALLISQCS